MAQTSVLKKAHWSRPNAQTRLAREGKEEGSVELLKLGLLEGKEEGSVELEHE